MKVLHICQNYNTKLYSDLFNELESFEIKQTVFFPYIGDFKYHKNAKIKIVSKKSVRSLFRHFFMLRAIYNYLNLVKSINVNNFDVIHCHTLYNDGIVGVIASFVYGKKLVITMRQSDIHIHKNKIWLRVFLLLYSKSKISYISVSPYIKKYFSHIPSKVIGNGIKDAFFQNAKEKFLRKGKIQLIYIGRIIKRKNLDVVLNLVTKYNEHYNLTIVGDRLSESKWSNEVFLRINTLKNVEYHASLSPNKIIDKLDESNIFIMPSINETFGIVYIEAMSRGLPIIYKKGTAVDGLFKKKVGLGLRSYNSNEIHSQINQILPDYEEISKNCMLYSRIYNWNNVAETIINIYNENHKNINNIIS